MARGQRFRGVRQRHWGSWVSEIRHPLLKTRIWLGTYETAEAAARAYDEVAWLMCGTSAKTNFPFDPNCAHNSRALSESLKAKLHKCCTANSRQEAKAGGKTSQASCTGEEGQLGTKTAGDEFIEEMIEELTYNGYMEITSPSSSSNYS